MKNILFIVPIQYGYHTGSYYYCELLNKSHNVFYVGIDYGKNVIYSYNHVHIYQIKKSNNKLRWRIDLFFLILKLLRQYKFEKTFVFYFPFCSLLLMILNYHSTIMDVRTSFVLGKYKTIILNNFLRFESCIFKRTTVISEGVVNFLKLKKAKCEILPLGGKQVDFFDREKMQMTLLYVGTFYDRYIEKTIEGLALFLKKNPNIFVKYTIIGFGPTEDIERIKNTIKNNALENIVFFIGEKRFKELEPYYKTHDVGVCFIPLTVYYDCQPPTKIYEYLLNGMAVIATPTYENRKVINQSNGILLEGDSIHDFVVGLEKLNQSIKLYNSFDIYKNAQQYSWEQIVNTTLTDIIMIK